jgi:hypothetical protein
MFIMLLLLTLILAASAGSTPARGAGSTQYFGIYYTVSTGGGSSYVTVGGQTYEIGSHGAATFCYIPDLDVHFMLNGSQYYSYSYDPIDMFPYAVDDRLFLIYENLPQESNPGIENTWYYVADPTNGVVSPSSAWFNFYYPFSFAIVGNSLYFQPSAYYDMFAGGWVGDQLMVVNLTSCKETQLLKQNDPDNYGTLISAGGNLFRYQFANENLTINQIDLDTGKIASGVQLFTPAAPNNGTFSDWSFSTDESGFYVAAKYVSAENTSEIYLWDIPLTEFENGSIPNGPNSAGGPDYWFSTAETIPLNDTSIAFGGIDACKGDLLLKFGNFTILYDTNANTYNTILGEKDNAQLFYGTTNPLIPEFPSAIALILMLSTASSLMATLTNRRKPKRT